MLDILLESLDQRFQINLSNMATEVLVMRDGTKLSPKPANIFERDATLLTIFVGRSQVRSLAHGRGITRLHYKYSQLGSKCKGAKQPECGRTCNQSVSWTVVMDCPDGYYAA